jgi:hypothetical protein
MDKDKNPTGKATLAAPHWDIPQNFVGWNLKNARLYDAAASQRRMSYAKHEPAKLHTKCRGCRCRCDGAWL